MLQCPQGLKLTNIIVTGISFPDAARGRLSEGGISTGLETKIKGIVRLNEKSDQVLTLRVGIKFSKTCHCTVGHHRCRGAHTHRDPLKRRLPFQKTYRIRHTIFRRDHQQHWVARSAACSRLSAMTRQTRAHRRPVPPAPARRWRAPCH